MAHLFFSYAHKDYKRLYPIHQQMELVSERLIWIDRIGLQRDAAWATMIERAINDSYGVIFAITQEFVGPDRGFIREREIPWAIKRFNNTRQGKLLFPILFDEVPLPEALTGADVTEVVHVIDARDGDLHRAIAELVDVIPDAKDGAQPFIVSWPRLANFKGRDAQLIDLHNKLHVQDGKVAIKTAGLYGMGGIGKTQLAVEFAYRYRFYFPGGVYWLNAAADWQKEIEAFAKHLRLTAADPNDPDRAGQMVIALKDHLANDSGDKLLVMDNVAAPSGLKNREIAPKLTVLDLCRATNTRLLMTTRVQALEGFTPVEVTRLAPNDALAVLLDPWHGGETVRSDQPDLNTLREIARLFDYLPLPLGWMAAALRQKPKLQPAALIGELRRQGVDDVITHLKRVGVSLGTPEYYEALLTSALDWQIEQIKNPAGLQVLAVIAAYEEAAVVPAARLRLLAHLEEDPLVDTFDEASAELKAYSLADSQADSTAYRLHPLTRQHVRQKLDAPACLAEAAPVLVAAYRTPAVIEQQTQTRGFAAVLEDLAATRQALSSPLPELDNLARLFILESDKLLTPPAGVADTYPVQQIRDRAHHQGDDDLRDACNRYLAGRRHFRADPGGMRYPASSALLRTLRGHTNWVSGALRLSDGRFLSWSDDTTLRLWDGQGQPLAVLARHTAAVYGALELSDGGFLSWSDDTTLRLWDGQGQPLAVLAGHTAAVYGALELSDGGFLSWSDDTTLRLWDGQGQPLAVLAGHTAGVRGVLALPNGRFLSWSDDTTLRLWDGQGQPLAVFEGHTMGVRGALALADGRFLSWSNGITLRLWDGQGKPLTVLHGHTNTVNGALALADGRFLSWAWDNTLRLWTGKGRLLAVLEGHTGAVNGALALADGRFLSWANDHTLRLWDGEGQPLADFSQSSDGALRFWAGQGQPLAVRQGHKDRVKGVLALSDSRFLSWAWEETLWLWSDQGQPLAVLQGHTGAVSGALALADGRFLSWANDRTLRLWDGQGQPLAAPNTHTGLVRGTLGLTDGRFLSWANDRTLRLWDGHGKTFVILEGHSGGVRGALELADGRFLSWCDDGTLHLWDAQGQVLDALDGHTDGVWGALELADGRLLSWANDNTLRLWNAQGLALRVLQGHTGAVRGALELADGRLLSWSDDNTLRLWTSQGRQIAVIRRDAAPMPLALTPVDDCFLSWSDGGTLWLWDGQNQPQAILQSRGPDGSLAQVDTVSLAWNWREKALWLIDRQGRSLAVLEGHTDTVRGALTLSDGRFLSWAWDCTLRLWSAQGRPLAVYHADAPITCCAEVRPGRIVFGDVGGRVITMDIFHD